MRRHGVLADSHQKISCSLQNPVPLGRNDLLVGRAAPNPNIYRPTPKDKWSRPRPSRAGFMGHVLEPLTGLPINEKYRDQVRKPNEPLVKAAREFKEAFPAGLPRNPVPFGLNRGGRSKIVPTHIRADALDLLNAPAAYALVADGNARAYARGAADANAIALANLGQPRGAFPEQVYQREQAVQHFVNLMQERGTNLDPLQVQAYVRSHLDEFLSDQIDDEELLDLEERANREMQNERARIEADPREQAEARARWEAEVARHADEHYGAEPPASERPGEPQAYPAEMEDREGEMRQQRADDAIIRGAERDVSSMQTQAAYSSPEARDERARARQEGSSSRPSLSEAEYLQLRRTEELKLKRGEGDEDQIHEEIRKIEHELHTIDERRYPRPNERGYKYTERDFERHAAEVGKYNKKHEEQYGPGGYAAMRDRVLAGPHGNIVRQLGLLQPREEVEDMPPLMHLEQGEPARHGEEQHGRRLHLAEQ